MRRLAPIAAQRLRASATLTPQPQRAFIKLPSLVPSEKTFSKRKTVPYSPQQARWACRAGATRGDQRPRSQIFDVVANVNDYHKFVPFCVCVCAPPADVAPAERASCTPAQLVTRHQAPEPHAARGGACHRLPAVHVRARETFGASDGSSADALLGAKHARRERYLSKARYYAHAQPTPARHGADKLRHAVDR